MSSYNIIVCYADYLQVAESEGEVVAGFTVIVCYADYLQVEESKGEVVAGFTAREGEMKARWELEVSAIATENGEIEDAWTDLRHQEQELQQLLQAEVGGDWVCIHKET